MLFLPGLECVLSKDLPPAPYRGRQFRLEFKDLRQQEAPYGLSWGSHEMRGNRVVRSRHLLIAAGSERAARNAMDLVLAGLVILHGGDAWLWLSESVDAYELLRVTRRFRLTIKEWQRLHTFPTSDAGQRACFFAARASRHVQMTYAALRLSQSFRAIAVPTMALDPFHSENLALPTLARPHLPALQVRLASAIVSAYASIEELGLEPRPKDKALDGESKYVRRSDTGEWGTKSREDLDARLRQAGVDPEMEILWSLRGRKRFLETGRNTTKARLAFRLPRSHARDEMVGVRDALADSSFLRNKVSAHRFCTSATLNRLRTLTHYDVANVQHLARYLVMKTVLGQQTGFPR